MFELAHEHGGELLDFMKKYGKLKKKGFLVNRSLEEKVIMYSGHPEQRGQKMFSPNHRVYRAVS
jgi:hypothetical protein